MLCVVVSAACAAHAPAAGAAGPPLPSGDSGKAGAVAPGGSERLVTRRAGDDTVVAAVRRGGGRAVLRSRVIQGHWQVPPVALDNATTGLSADGRTLVLVRPTRHFPPAGTRLAVLDARRLIVRREIALPGFFTVDAISPDGHSVFVIQYAGDNVLDYRVRALDTRTGRLAARDVVDPRAPDEQMGGLPMARATSADGRWAYTLYGGGTETFIHALDTVGRTAACIDLDIVPPQGDLSGLRLRVGAAGRRVLVRDRGRLVGVVDAHTFAVSPSGAPAAEARPTPTRRGIAPSDGDGGFPWVVLALGLGAAGVFAVTLLAERRRAGGARRQGLPARVGSPGAGPEEA
jgi:hypothetical protein